MVGHNLKDFELLNLFIQWGKVVKGAHIPLFRKYLSEMLERNRILVVEGEEGIECIIAFFLTDDIKGFSNRPMWSTPKDSEEAKTIFIDKMVARKWTKPLRIAVQDAIETRYPFLEEAFWLREPKNRGVKINKRRSHVYSEVSG